MLHALRTMLAPRVILGTAALGLAATTFEWAPVTNDDERPFTETFAVADSEWASTGVNPFFNLEPAYSLELEGEDEGKPAKLVITVLDETLKVDGVETRVVEERETVGGLLIEVSRNYFAFSKRSGSVFYFGEDVDIYKDGKMQSHEGSWRSGVAGAKFGLQMPGLPLLGARYCEERAPGVALDRAEIVSLSESLEAPAGKFEKCLKTLETNALKPTEKEHKIYAPGIGLVSDGEVKLARYGKQKPKK